MYTGTRKTCFSLHLLNSNSLPNTDAFNMTGEKLENYHTGHLRVEECMSKFQCLLVLQVPGCH